MHINRYFELSMVLDSDKFNEIFAQSYGGEKYADEEEYIDQTMEHKGIVVKYRASTYKKKVQLIVDAAAVTNGRVSDAEKLIHRLEKHIEKYFDSNYLLTDFIVSGMTLTANIDVGNRQNAAEYLQVIQRIGKVRGFSPTDYECFDEGASFCLHGNSNGIDFLLYDLEQVAAYQSGNAEGILQAEVRLMKPKAIQKYTLAYTSVDQILELSQQCQCIFMDVFVRVIPFGDFYKKKDAVEIIRREIPDQIMKRRMLRLLSLIPEKKSLKLAQKAMQCRNVEAVMIAFAKISLSPVTIPKRKDTKHLKNLYECIL